MDVVPIPGFAEPFSCWSHLLAAGTSLAAGIYLVKKGRGNGWRTLSLCVFSFALVFLFSMSGVYHLLDHGTAGRMVLQRLDHAAIWILVAGTFTPIHVILFRGVWRWGILLLVWTAAITFLVLEVIFFKDIPESLSLSLYLSLGWLGLLSGFKLVRQFSTSSVNLLIAGGLAYSIGGVLEFFRWPIVLSGVIGPHELFHMFVMLAAFCHWKFVYNWSSHPVGRRIVFTVQILPENKFVAKARGENIHVVAESIEGLRENIRTSVEHYFHDSLKPESINLKFSSEEYLPALP